MQTEQLLATQTTFKHSGITACPMIKPETKGKIARERKTAEWKTYVYKKSPNFILQSLILNSTRKKTIERARLGKRCKKKIEQSTDGIRVKGM